VGFAKVNPSGASIAGATFRLEDSKGNGHGNGDSHSVADAHPDPDAR